MDKGYVHVEIESAQVSKRKGTPCGDVFAYDRNTSATTIVVSDGLGSGVKAYIAAEMCASRLLGLISQGYSARRAFGRLVKSMNEARGTEYPYAVFTIVRILNDGVATVLSYEMPAPILVTSTCAQVLSQHKVDIEGSEIGEATCHLEPGEGLFVVTDGITQAGLGDSLANGWTIKGVSQFVCDCISSGVKAASLPGYVLSHARDIWGTRLGDDCTAVMAHCRPGKIVNIFTGPPVKKIHDRGTVERFLHEPGAKVVCGGTTSRIVADYLGTEVSVELDTKSQLSPARYRIEGIDLVTEGAITLNQVYNTLEEASESFEEVSGVTELHSLLRSADRVNIIVGRAVNPAWRDIGFRQRGILTRHAIVPLLADKLRAMGKLVVLTYV